MTQTASLQRFVSLIVLSLWLWLAVTGLFDGAARGIAQSEANCVACHRQQKNKAGEVVAIYQTSTHRKVSTGCDGCHGGDPSHAEKPKAHSGNFIARPDMNATLEMCGKCHQQPLEFFKSSRHFSGLPGLRRLDCVDCHGVHGIGAASESFRWPVYCAGCHGLEYLPALVPPFQEMLGLVDDLNDRLHRMEAKGRAPATELIKQRKAIRRMVSEVVHPTEAQSGAERIPRILELGAILKRQIASAEKQ